MVQDAAAAKDAAQVVADFTKDFGLVPVKVVVPNVMAAEPVFLRVMVWAGEVWPSGSEAKVRVVGEMARV